MKKNKCKAVDLEDEICIECVKNGVQHQQACYEEDEDTIPDFDELKIMFPIKNNHLPFYEVIDGQTEICEFDGVEAAIVYTGGFSGLEKAELKWHTISNEYTGDTNVLTLDEVVEQLRTDPEFDPQITVFIDGPLSGEIWRYGNYNDHKWYRTGNTAGYA